MWQGDFTSKPTLEQRKELLEDRARIVKEIESLRIKPLPQGDPNQMQRFRQKDLLALATRVVKIDQKLGRIK